MTDQESYEDLLANIKAVEMVVRGLFAKWAGEADDPPASAFRMIEGIIASMHHVREGADENERRVLMKIEDHLRDFGENIQIRLAAEK